MHAHIIQDNGNIKIYLSTVSEPSDISKIWQTKPVSCSNNCATIESYTNYTTRQQFWRIAESDSLLLLTKSQLRCWQMEFEGGYKPTIQCNGTQESRAVAGKPRNAVHHFLPTHTDSSIVIIINDYQSLFASYVYIICMTNKDVKFHSKF